MRVKNIVRKLTGIVVAVLFLANTAFAAEYVINGNVILNSQGLAAGNIINGKAFDNNGNPISNATFTKTNANGTSSVVTSDTDGNLPPDDQSSNNNGNNGGGNIPIPPLGGTGGGTNGGNTGGTGVGGGTTGGGTTGGGNNAGTNPVQVNPPQALANAGGGSSGGNVSPGTPMQAIYGEFTRTGVPGTPMAGQSYSNFSNYARVAIKDRVERNLTGTAENDMMDSFNGWSDLYRGTRNTSIMTDPYNLSAQYPELFFDRNRGNRPSLGQTYQQSDLEQPFGQDIGVDDEILKTSMAIYTPNRVMQKDFLEDQAARDAYLNNALSIRGIAIMTMGFLDKTVGAGLTAIQQQADQEVQNNLLKQISWTTSKMANPDRAQIYRDTDEKLEACLEQALSQGKAENNIQGQTRRIANFTCDPRCGEAPTNSSKIFNSPLSQSGYPQLGNGSYSYCVCCAETKSELNKLTEDGENKYSLAERLFVGTKRAQGSDSSKIQNALKWFRYTYGDVIIESKQTSGEGSVGSFRYVYQAPKYSVRRFASAFKDGCKEPNNPEAYRMDQNVGTNCSDLQADFNIQYGICPALVGLLQNWEQISAGNRSPDDAVRWLEASMGIMLSADDITNILHFNGDERTTLQVNEEPSGGMRRYIRNFCNASAFAAVSRFHAMQSQIINDHITLNQQLSSSEKAKIIELMSRVSQHIALAEKDATSSYPVETLITGLSVKAGREAAAKQAAIAAASSGQQARASENSGTSLFGIPGSFYAQQGGGGPNRRSSDPISNVLDSIK